MYELEDNIPIPEGSKHSPFPIGTHSKYELEDNVPMPEDIRRGPIPIGTVFKYKLDDNIPMPKDIVNDPNLIGTEFKYKLEDNISIPRPNRGAIPSKYPFSSMSVGQEIFIPYEDNTQHSHALVLKAINRINRITNIKLEWEAEDDGIRVRRAS